MQWLHISVVSELYILSPLSYRRCNPKWREYTCRTKANYSRRSSSSYCSGSPEKLSSASMDRWTRPSSSILTILPLNHALVSPIPLYIALFSRQSSASALIKLFLCSWLVRLEFQLVGPPIDDSVDSMFFFIAAPKKLATSWNLKFSIYLQSGLARERKNTKHATSLILYLPVEDVLIGCDKVSPKLKFDNHVIIGGNSPFWRDILDQSLCFCTT